MAINDVIKEVMKTHKSKIEITQWAIINGVASLVYSEYLYNMRNKVTPAKTFMMVPKISAVKEFLKEDGELINWISENLIDSMIMNKRFNEFIDIPELVMFKDNNVEILKTILDLYIIPNISRHIPETIAIKFSLGDPKNQTFIESNDADLFGRESVKDYQVRFLSDEIVLQLLSMLPSIKKNIDIPETNSKIQMSKDEILIVKNGNAICPVMFDKDIFKNEVMNMMSFVTNTTIDTIGDSNLTGYKNNGLTIDYIVTSSPFNNVTLLNLKLEEEKNESNL